MSSTLYCVRDSQGQPLSSQYKWTLIISTYPLSETVHIYNLDGGPSPASYLVARTSGTWNNLNKEFPNLLDITRLARFDLEPNKPEANALRIIRSPPSQVPRRYNSQTWICDVVTELHDLGVIDRERFHKLKFLKGEINGFEEEHQLATLFGTMDI